MINDITSVLLTNFDGNISTPTLNYIAYRPALISQPVLLSGIKPSYYSDIPFNNYLLIEKILNTNQKFSVNFQSYCNDGKDQNIEDCVIVQSKKIAAEIIGKSGKSFKKSISQIIKEVLKK